MKSASVIAELRAGNEELGTIVANSKDFSTGSRGYYGNGKMELNGARYQVSVMLVEIGSKPGSTGSDAKASPRKTPLSAKGRKA